MSRMIRKRLLETFETIQNANQLMWKLLSDDETEETIGLLTDCQDCAVAIGTQIEKIYGADLQTIHILEEYCETLYQLTQVLSNMDKRQEVYWKLDAELRKIRDSIEKEIPDKLEAVFLPYKVSMWDSLESIWMAADADPNCDAYVIPIPYYDKNSDGSFKREHYEGGEYPEDIPVTNYHDYNFELRCPDLIFIHNPYDQYNNVTSVHPFFYSKNLKRFTDCLVYVPYYSTSGGMSDAQSHCMAYYFVDYIVIQAEKYRKFFDPDLPQNKLLPFGSPKFDKVIRLCENPPEPPADWRTKMKGKTVYFYNTSINGMLGNTSAFLKKMEYVFKCFEGREDVCLVWRPHPLLESTFASMRQNYKPVYDALKKYYLESNFGIYDNTPEITDTIALCDAYIGDAGTSVTSLFGIAGKPLFIFNNNIDCLPDENDWRGEIIKGFYAYGNDEWMITQGNKLYHSPGNNYQYEYFCDLSDYAYGDYYSYVISVAGQNYVCPANAQNILVIGHNGISEKIELKHFIEQKGAFYGAIGCGNYLFLLPNNYPAIVRYNTKNGEIKYLKEHLDIFNVNFQGQKRLGGYCVWKEYIFIASPIDNQVLAIHAETGKMQVLSTAAKNNCGCAVLQSDGIDLWFLPYFGYTITRWNPESGELHEYTDVPQGIQCSHPLLGYECEERPFGFAAFCNEYVYLPPYWGNRYVRLNKQTGEMIEWRPPYKQPERAKNGYFVSYGKGHFYRLAENGKEKRHYFFSALDRKLYSVNLQSDDYKEIEIGFYKSDIEKKEPGFQENSEWLKYACQENAFNTLPNFLDGKIIGNVFDRGRQIQAYGEIAVNHDGTCGEKVYEFIKEKLLLQ